jgi:predicted transposase YdaD
VSERCDFDGLLKDMFQHDRPIVIDWLTGGIPVREFLNVEVQTVQQKRVDLVMKLANQSIVHVEFQSSNDPRMAQRMALYHLLLTKEFRLPARHVVLYVGSRPLGMSNWFVTPSMAFRCDVIDIRSFDAADLLASGRPADCVLAMLAAGGESRLDEILERLRGLPQHRLRRALAQLSVLCDLRTLSGRVKKELETMPVVMDISKNVILREILERGREEGRAEGRAEGKAEGKAEGVRTLLHDLLADRFGPLPRWASMRLAGVGVEEARRLTLKAATAASLEDVLGRRRVNRRR